MKITIGQIVEKKKVFDMQSVVDYARLTGDYNPVHFDDIYASKTIFKKPIVHGPLILTMVTTMFANELPGPGSVYLSHDVKYFSPVYYNDEITARLEVIEINNKNHIFIKTTCFNQLGKIILDGIARLKIY
ncbi:MaoC family dehydratase [Flavobacterium sp. GSB-24]|uniref:MaoC family dehydratase n=1 Tax=Flavobacterium sp. GSB-24 TaxID=2994319 RepID=UPI00249334BC|nr:MaoC family dehydratase [Flavobacterium sp. GSB-24]BDU23560.1 3-hydroxybutyryl-CoA dehydratase [Flavobacterium sp. GSB-24]